MIRNELIIILIFLIPKIGISQDANYPNIDGCKIITDLLSDVKDGNLDYQTHLKYFNLQHEIEVMLEFEWCRINNVEADSCPLTIKKQFGDSSLTLIRIESEFGELDQVDSKDCRIVSDKYRGSDYVVKLNNKNYIFQIDKKLKAVHNIISQDTLSLFINSNSWKSHYKELIEKYLFE